MAQSVASLADAAPGRFAFGIGTSSNVIVERWNGVPFVEPYKRVRDMVRFLKEALAGEKVQPDLRHLRGAGLPARRAARRSQPKILVAALRPGMLRLAGREADGAIINWLSRRGRDQGGADRARRGRRTRRSCAGSSCARRTTSTRCARRQVRHRRLPERAGVRRLPRVARPRRRAGPACGRPGRRAIARRPWPPSPTTLVDELIVHGSPGAVPGPDPALLRQRRDDVVAGASCRSRRSTTPRRCGPWRPAPPDAGPGAASRGRRVLGRVPPVLGVLSVTLGPAVGLFGEDGAGPSHAGQADPPGAGVQPKGHGHRRWFEQLQLLGGGCGLGHGHSMTRGCHRVSGPADRRPEGLPGAGIVPAWYARPRSAGRAASRWKPPLGKEESPMGRLLKVLGLAALIAAVVVVVKQARASRQVGDADASFGATVSSLRDRATDKVAEVSQQAADATEQAAKTVTAQASAAADGRVAAPTAPREPSRGGHGGRDDRCGRGQGQRQRPMPPPLPPPRRPTRPLLPRRRPPAGPRPPLRRPRSRPRPERRPAAPGQRATKYLARGWWQMIADVVCSGWYCQPVSSLTSMPSRSAPSSSATVALSSRSGQAG